MNDLELNKTQLLFVPGVTEKHASTVTQVTVQSDTQPVSFETLAAYHLAQPKLTKLILLVLAHHTVRRLPSRTTLVGDGFSVEASHLPWTYGKRWDFKWGNDSIRPAEDKWKFVFRTR